MRRKEKNSKQIRRTGARALSAILCAFLLFSLLIGAMPARERDESHATIYALVETDPGEDPEEADENPAETPESESTEDSGAEPAETTETGPTEEPETEPAGEPETEPLEEPETEPGKAPGEDPDAAPADGAPYDNDEENRILEAEISGVKITVETEEGLPAGAELILDLVDDEDVISAAGDAAVEDVMENAGETTVIEAVEVLDVQAVTITILDENGDVFEPDNMKVTVSSDVVAAADEEPVVVLVDDQGETAVAETPAADVQQEGAAEEGDRENSPPAADAVQFETDAPAAVYVVVSVRTLTKEFIAADGETYQITVTYAPDAEIPEGAELAVEEIREGTEAYEAAYEETVRVLSDENGVAAVGQARFFDISIVFEGERIEPAAPVQVQVEYTEPVALVEDTTFQVVHFAEEDSEVLEASSVDDDGREISAFDFETSSFSTFAFAQSNYIGSLAGQSFAIVRDNGVNMAAVLSEAHPTVAGRLRSVWVNVLEDGMLAPVTEANGTTESDDEITSWTFEHLRDNVYSIESDGRYMCIGSGGLTMESVPCPLEVVPLMEGGRYTGKIRIRSAEDTGSYLNLKGGNVNYGFQKSPSTDKNSSFALYSSEDNVIRQTVTARKVRADEIQAGSYVVIYQRFWNEAVGKYEYYAVGGDGTLVYAFDEGDVITYRAGDAEMTQWYVIEHINESTGLPSGYYDFQNAKTGKYLAPQVGSILSDDRLGVVLNGRRDGEANTTIEGWDNLAWSWVGFRLDVDNRVLVPGTGAESTDFSFALPTEGFVPAVFHEVDTVDSTGVIRISMYDFSDRETMNIVDDDTWYQNGEFRQGLVQNRLGSDGLPVSVGGTSFSALYNEENYKGDANHLFLQSVYDTTGYYEYNSFTNFAHYDTETGEFTVYDEQGTPSNGMGGSKSSYYRGNFLPYDMMDAERPATNTKLYDNGTDLTVLENPYFNSTLYLMEPVPPGKSNYRGNYFFGTIIEASFLQPENGLDEAGAPIVYQFEGDDDLWVFLDGVLVLDIGGIHGAIHGSINYATGEVNAGGILTTIRQSFENAGVFPDGSEWNDDLADNYFKGDTFNNYSSHVMKMIYQERGAGASTLQVRFNLPVVESGTFAVEKKLGGTGQQSYSGTQFAYQAFIQAEDGEDIPLYPGVILSSTGSVIDPAAATDEEKAGAVQVTFENDGSSVDFYDDVVINGAEYDHVFYLKPEETAVFSGIPEQVEYYVREIGVSGAHFETVMINDTDMGGESGIGEDSFLTAVSSAQTIQERQRVVFKNICTDRNTRELRITKQVENPIDDGATFEFRVLLEGKDGSLTYYNKGEYYLVKVVDGVDHYYKMVNGVLTDQGTEPVVFSESGAYGTIAGIPDGFTVVIGGLLAETDFYVEEIRNPAGYDMVSKDVIDGTCAAADLSGADGKIELGEDAEMVITNCRYSIITVEKIWQDTDAHGDIQVALYKRSGDRETYVPDSVRTISWPETSTEWHVNLGEGETLEPYVVREVIVGSGGEEPTPLTEDYAPLPVLVDDAEQVCLFVEYKQGDEMTSSGTGSSAIHTRSDTITNAFPSLTLVKTNADGVGLSGAEFRLLDSEGNPLDGYGELISDEDGIIVQDITLPAGTYYLKETDAPENCVPLSHQVRITVGAGQENGAVVAVEYDPESGQEGAAYTDTDDDPLIYAYRIVNGSGLVLPNSGGMGAERFTAAGALIALGAGGCLAFIGWRKRRRQG